MGSVEAKAQIKEKLIPYVVGCAIMFGAFGIWKSISRHTTRSKLVKVINILINSKRFI